MAFDLKKYWERRKKGLRGQGNTARTSVVIPVLSPNMEPYKHKEKALSKYAIRKNTKRARKAQKNAG